MPLSCGRVGEGSRVILFVAVFTVLTRLWQVRSSSEQGERARSGVETGIYWRSTLSICTAVLPSREYASGSAVVVQSALEEVV